MYNLESIIPNYKLIRKIKNLIIANDKEELDPEYLYFKLKEDMPKLEKYTRIQNIERNQKKKEKIQEQDIPFTKITN